MRIKNIVMCCVIFNVPRLKVYLDQKTKDKLKEIYDEENRPVSRQIKYMLEFYLQYKNKVK